MATDGNKKRKVVARRKTPTSTIVKTSDGTTTRHANKKESPLGHGKSILKRVDRNGDAHYRQSKPTKYKAVKQAPAFDSKKRKVSKRKWTKKRVSPIQH